MSDELNPADYGDIESCYLLRGDWFTRKLHSGRYVRMIERLEGDGRSANVDLGYVTMMMPDEIVERIPAPTFTPISRSVSPSADASAQAPAEFSRSVGAPTTEVTE
jgi:hypothetical protein